MNAVEQLNYKPNLLARNFTQSRSYSILVLAPLSNPFLMDVIKGIQEVARVKGYTVLLVDKLENLNASSPEMIVTSNIGCLMHLQSCCVALLAPRRRDR